MRRLLFCTLAATLLSSAWWVSSYDTAVIHADAGPTIAVGTPILSGGNVIVPIDATGAGFANYAGFDIHLRWDPANFRFLQATTSGGIFDNSSNNVACVGYIVDPNGGGFFYSCYFPTGSTSSTGLLALITLAPLQTGCSRLHLVTPADNYPSPTQTIEQNTGQYQVNAYADGSATESGSPCVAGTPTPGTPLATPTNTPTPTATSAGGPTPTPINGTVGPLIEVGTPSTAGGKVVVPIVASGTGFNPYIAYQVHLRWDPNVFQFDSVSTAGAVLEPVGGNAYCLGGGNNHLPDADGAGMAFACISLSRPVTSTGLLVTMNLTPKQFGCSALHLTTVGAPDYDIIPTATYLPNANYETNQLVDGSVCYAPPPTPTPTSTPTNTPAPMTIGNPAVGGVTNLETRSNRPAAHFSRGDEGSWSRSLVASVVGLCALIAIGAGYGRMRSRP